MNDYVENLNKIKPQVLYAAVLLTVGISAVGAWYWHNEKELKFREDLENQKTQQASQREKELVEQKNSNKILLDLCLSSAQENYKSRWASSCQSHADEVKIDYQSCLNNGLSALTCKSIHGEPDPSEDCKLPTQLADSYGNDLKGAKDECYKRYPATQ